MISIRNIKEIESKSSAEQARAGQEPPGAVRSCFLIDFNKKKRNREKDIAQSRPEQATAAKSILFLVFYA